MTDTKLFKAKNNEAGTFGATLTAVEVGSATVTPVPANAPGVIFAEPGTNKEEAIFYKTRDALAGTIGGLTRDYTNLNGGVGQEHINGEDWETLQAIEYVNNLVDAVQQGFQQEMQTIAKVDADTFTVVSDRTAYYTKGRIIRFNQDSTKIAIVSASSYNSGTGLTTVDVVFGTVPTLTHIEYDNRAKSVTAAPLELTGVDAGTANVMSATLAPAPAAYMEGMKVFIKVLNDNTGATTINLNTLGAKNVLLPDLSRLAPGIIRAGNYIGLVYDGTQFILLSIKGQDGWVDLTDAATIDIDLRLGSKFRIKDMGGNRTLTISNYSALIGKIFELEIWQDGTGSRTITHFTGNSTFETADVVAATNIITVGRDIPTCTPIKFSSATTVPAGLTAGTKYYAIRQSATTIKVATSLANAQAGTEVDITDTGTGQHTIKTLVRWPLDTEPTLTTGKYLVDTFVFQQALSGVFRGYTAGQAV
jgi:hypothetical protein